MGSPHPDKSSAPVAPLTKILLAVWAVVTIPGGLLLLFVDAFANSVVWPAPLEPIPPIHARFNGTPGFGTGLASVLALRQNRWGSAQPIIGLYISCAVFAECAALRAIIARQVPLHIWFYAVLGIFYLVSSFIVWRQQQG